jgi:hypothetical protein
MSVPFSNGALEISTERRPSNHQPGNASADPAIESRECPVECRNHPWTLALLGFDPPCPDTIRKYMQIALAFGVDINKDVVRRILGMHCEADPIWGAFPETSVAPVRIALSQGTESPGQGQPTALSFANFTAESEPGESAMSRATGRFAQILRARSRVNVRMNMLTKWDHRYYW